MIHITKAKNGYMGIVAGKNGEVLSTTEILATKENVINNILAQAGNYVRILFYTIIYCDKFIYQDDTYKVPKLFLCSIDTLTKKKSITELTKSELKKFKLTIKSPKYKKQEARIKRIQNTKAEETNPVKIVDKSAYKNAVKKTVKKKVIKKSPTKKSKKKA